MPVFDFGIVTTFRHDDEADDEAFIANIYISGSRILPAPICIRVYLDAFDAGL